MNEQPRSLHDLALAAADAHPGDSDRLLAERAAGAGYTINRTTLSAIKAGSYRSRPSHKTLDALAWLAGVSRETAYTAAGEYLSPNPFADELPPEADRLTPKQRAAVIGVIRTMLDPGLPATRTDEVPGATKTPAAQHYPASAPAGKLPDMQGEDDELVVRPNPIVSTWTDVTTTEADAAAAQQQLETDDDLYSRWLDGEDGFDEVTTRRFVARAEKAGDVRQALPDEDTATAPAETEEEQYLRYLRGDVDFDDATRRRFEQRVQDAVPRAARRGTSDADVLRAQLDAQAEGADPDGPDDGA